MAGSVRDLPGMRPGARAFLFVLDEEDGFATHVEDFGPDTVSIVAPDFDEMAEPLRLGDPMELELPQVGGSMFLVGRLARRRTNEAIPLLVMQVEEVGVDTGLGQTREARAHFRQSLWLPVAHLAYHLPAGGSARHPGWHEASGILRDMSAGGASVLVDAEIPTGSRIRLDTPVPLEPHGMVMSGTVVHQRATGTERRPRWIVHVRFDNLERAHRSWLVGQLNRYQWLTRWRQR